MNRPPKRLPQNTVLLNDQHKERRRDNRFKSPLFNAPGTIRSQAVDEVIHRMEDSVCVSCGKKDTQYERVRLYFGHVTHKDRSEWEKDSDGYEEGRSYRDFAFQPTKNYTVMMCRKCCRRKVKWGTLTGYLIGFLFIPFGLLALLMWLGVNLVVGWFPSWAGIKEPASLLIAIFYVIFAGGMCLETLIDAFPSMTKLVIPIRAGTCVEYVAARQGLYVSIREAWASEGHLLDRQFAEATLQYPNNHFLQVTHGDTWE